MKLFCSLHTCTILYTLWQKNTWWSNNSCVHKWAWVSTVGRQLLSSMQVIDPVHNGSEAGNFVCLYHNIQLCVPCTKPHKITHPGCSQSLKQYGAHRVHNFTAPSIGCRLASLRMLDIHCRCSKCDESLGLALRQYIAWCSFWYYFFLTNTLNMNSVLMQTLCGLF